MNERETSSFAAFALAALLATSFGAVPAAANASPSLANHDDAGTVAQAETSTNERPSANAEQPRRLAENALRDALTLDFASPAATTPPDPALTPMSEEAVQAALIAKGGTAPNAGGQATSAPLIDAPTAKLSYTSTSSDGAQDYVSDGTTSGSAGAARALTSMSAHLEGIDGSVRYATRLSSLGWTQEASDAAPCGNGRMEALRIRLTGFAASCLDVYYRVHVSQIGWLDWASNGQDAGSTGMSLPVEAYEVRLVTKGADAPGPTSMPYARNVTGDTELDAILNSIIHNVTGTGPDALRRGYNYMMEFPFRTGNVFPIGAAPTWLVPYAKEMYQIGSGNCYRSASLMCAIAKALGYDATVIAGGLRTKNGIESHAWTEVRLGGRILMLDPNMERNFRDRNFYLVTYAQAPAEYHKQLW